MATVAPNTDGPTLELAWSDAHSPSTEDVEAAERPAALTPRELEVAKLVALGLTNAEIGGRLGISAGTARVHIERILSKLGLTSRVQIATWIVRNTGDELGSVGA